MCALPIAHQKGTILRRLIAVIPAAAFALSVSSGSLPAAADSSAATAARAAAGPTQSVAARAAAAWIGHQLAAGGDVLGSPTDWGMTQDAVFALAATGYGGDQIAKTSGRIFSSGTEYIGTSKQASKNWARIAKTALALQVAGRDATAFPTSEGARDLLQEVRAARNPDGSFGTSDFAFVHSLAVITLARTPGGVPAESVRWLQNQQCTTASSPDFGGYGTGGCTAVDGDATALTIQALRAAGVSSADASVADAATWLTKHQNKASGGFPSSSGALNTNTTGLAGQALRELGRTSATAAGARFIEGLQVQCTSLKGSAFTAADVGAIAFDRTAWADSRAYGIGTTTGQWLRASTQAVLGLTGSRLDQLSVTGARASLPKTGCSAGKPAPRVAASATANKSKLAVKVTPKRPTGKWTVRVQKKTRGAWQTVKPDYRIKGGAAVLTVNLPKGQYRAKVLAKNGYRPAISQTVRLAR